MATFQQDLVDFMGDAATTGDLAITATMVDGWLLEGSRDVIMKTPAQKLWGSAAQTTVTASSGTSITNRKILGVTRSDGNSVRPARPVSFMLEGRLSDREDTQFAIKEDPVWFIKDQTLFIKPNPATPVNGFVHAVSFPTPSATASSIAGFEDTAESLVRTYTKIQAKHRESGLGRRKAQDEIEAMTSISASLTTTYTAIDTALDAASAVLGSATLTNQIGSATGALSNITTAISSATNELVAAVDVLSTATNSVRDILVAASSATPSGIEAINTINSDRIEKADRSINLGVARISEASSYISTAQTYIQTAQASRSQSDGYLGVLSGVLDQADGYIKEASSRSQMAQTQVAQMGVRVQSGNHYLQHSAEAHIEAQDLQKRYDTELNGYING